MRYLKQEIYFPIIVLVHFGFWAIDLSFYSGNFIEKGATTFLFGELHSTWANPHRILGEVFSSWVVTVFAFNFLMATRAKWVEQIFGGLDKMYLIHRRSGVIAVFLLLAHFVVVPRAVEFNPGKPLGFYAFALIIIGVILSAAPIFKKKIPYHKWLNIHKLMGIFYVLGVVHGLLVDSLIKELPITRVYVFGMSAVGVAAWFYRAFLFRKFNKNYTYTIQSTRSLPNDIAEVVLESQTDRMTYLAGQFSFFKFPAISSKEQHPFTLSSHPYEDTLRITVKGLGDYTNCLHEKLKPGDIALVEGPYGHFSSAHIKEKEQIWIAGGIGITPFLSLAKDMYMHQVKLYWCVASAEDATYRDELEVVSSNNKKFSFQIWPSDTNGHLTLEKMDLDNLQTKGFLICGPEALKRSFMSQLKAAGVDSAAIYDEEFAFR